MRNGFFWNKENKKQNMLDGNHLNITFAIKKIIRGKTSKTTTTNENYTFFASITFNKLPALYETENIKEIVLFF